MDIVKVDSMEEIQKLKEENERLRKEIESLKNWIASQFTPPPQKRNARRN